MHEVERAEWKRALLLAFLGGFFLVAGLDYFHAWTGVENYFVRPFTVTARHWPLFVPLQMGLAGVVGVLAWVAVRRRIIDPWCGAEASRRRTAWGALSVTCVIFGYGVGFVFMDEPSHLSWYFIFYFAALFLLALVGSWQQLAAFLSVGAAGCAAEWLLLDPRIGYYSFFQQDLFGRLPGWLPFVWGWVGVFLNTISADLKGARVFETD